MEWIIFGILAIMFILLIIILQEILNIKDRIDNFDVDLFLTKKRIYECLDGINNNKNLINNNQNLICEIKSSLNIDILKNINNLINDRFDKNAKEIELFKQTYNNNIITHLKNFTTILSTLGDLKDNIKCNKSNNSITTQLDSLFIQIKKYHENDCLLLTNINDSIKKFITELVEDNIKYHNTHYNDLNKIIGIECGRVIDRINNTNNINNTNKSNKAKNSLNNNKTNKLLSQKKKSNTKLKTATTFDNGDTHD